MTRLTACSSVLLVELMVGRKELEELKKGRTNVLAYLMVYILSYRLNVSAVSYMGSYMPIRHRTFMKCSQCIAVRLSTLSFIVYCMKYEVDTYTVAV